MQALLCFGYAAACAHERRVEEIRVPIMQLAPYPSKRARRECPKCLLLTSRDIAQNANVLRENVLAGADNCDRCGFKLLLAPLSIWTLTTDRVFLKFRKNVTNFETFLKIVILVGVDKL